MTTRTWLDNSDNWTTAADWSGGVVPKSNDDVVILQGGDPQVTAAIAVHSIADYGQINFANAGGSSVGGDVSVAPNSFFDFDSNFNSGGSTLSISGTLTNRGYVTIGNPSSSGSTTLTATSLVNVGTLALNSAQSQFTFLNIAAAAGFGTAGSLTGTVTMSGNSVVRFASGSIRTIAAGGNLTLNGPSAYIADAGSTNSNSALTGLTLISANASLQLNSSVSVAPGGGLTNYGTIDIDQTDGSGGSTLTVAAAMTNHRTLQIGNSDLSFNAIVHAKSLKNTGTVKLVGSDTQSAYLDLVESGANLGASGTISGTISLSGHSSIEIGSGKFTTIDQGASLTLSGPDAFIYDAGLDGTNSALSGLAYNNGSLELLNGAEILDSGSLRNSGSLTVGGHLSVAGTFNNTGNLYVHGPLASGITGELDVERITNSGYVEVGFFGKGVLKVAGGAGFGTGGVVTGDVSIYDGSSIQFGSGQIYDVRGDLLIDAGYLSIAGQANSNSALTHLRQNEGRITIDSETGQTSVIATSAAFANSGELDVFGGTFSSAGTLTNTGTVLLSASDGAGIPPSMVSITRLRNSGTISMRGSAVDHSSASAQVMAVGTVAGTGTPGILTGTIDLTDNASLRFASGQIKKIEGSLRLESQYAFVADQSSISSNSALTGLSEVDGTLELDDHATLTATGALKNVGHIIIDGAAPEFSDPYGGSHLSIGGAIDNVGDFDIGTGALASSSVVVAASFTNDGTLTLTGNGSNLAWLDLRSATLGAGFGTAGTVTGDIKISGDSLIEFSRGAIDTIATGASLDIDGPNAFVALNGVTSANSALRGLDTIDGQLSLEDGATIVTTQDLEVHHYGTPFADDFDLVLDQTGSGGSILSVGGTIENSGVVQIGNAAMTSADDVAVSAFDNEGFLTLHGGAQGEAVLAIGSAAGFGSAGELTGTISLVDNSLIAFASGSISTIDTGASLTLDGVDARIADQGSTSSNSALTGLAENDGGFNWLDAALVQTNGALANYGVMQEDQMGAGGSQLSVNGKLDNEMQLYIGNALMGTSDSVSAASLVNNGSITLHGHGAAHAQLNISGATTNNGNIFFNSDVQKFTGAINGTGTMYMYAGTNLEFDNSVAASQELAYGGSDKLVLGNAKTFAASIAGFASGDTVDLKTFGPGSSLSYTGNSAGGVLSVTSGANVAHLNFLGSFTTASFSAAADGAGGLLIGHT